MKLRNTKFGRFRKVNKAFPPPKRMRDKVARRKRSFRSYIDIVVFTINCATNKLFILEIVKKSLLLSN